MAQSKSWCDFIRATSMRGDHYMVCRQCGRQMRVVNPDWRPDRYRALCRVEKRLSLLARTGYLVAQAGRYAKALARWTASGFGRRSRAEVARIAAICRDCEHWQPDEKVEGNGVCTHCGCRGGERRLAVANMWKQQTKHCPIGKW